jgi:plastocyanin
MMTASQQSFRPALILLLMLGIVGCGTSSAPSAAAGSPTPAPKASTRPANQIDALDSYMFAPTKLTVKAGTEVTWFEATRFTPHNVRLDGDPANVTHDLSEFGQTFKFTFNKTGTFHFICSLHEPGMTGDVVVEP